MKVAAALLFVTAMVWQHIQAIRLGYQLDKSRQHLLTLRCSYGMLQGDIETLLSPANLSLQARSRLGMSLGSLDSLRVLAKDPAENPCSGIFQRLLSRARRTWNASLDV